MNEKILEILRKNNYPDGEHDDDEICAIELEQLFDAEVNKMVSERLREELISLTVWLLPFQGKAGGIIEATIVIDEYLKSREK